MAAFNDEPMPSWEDVKRFILGRLGDSVELSQQVHSLQPVTTDESSDVNEWLGWCHRRPGVMTVDASVPSSILPAGAMLTDIKVGSKKREPDDRIYNKNADIRRRVARGNSVLRVADGRAFCLLHALRKFSGGMGDEDDGDTGEPDSNTVWRRYFLEPPETADRLVMTQKANGEAAHLSVRWMHGAPLLCVGSKNVHMAIRRRDDIDLYDTSRYQVAREVGAAIWRQLSVLQPQQRSMLLALMHHTRATCVLELLQPEHQHVEDLSHLSEPELRFIAWTPSYRPPAGADDDADAQMAAASLTLCPPELSFRLAELLGLTPVSYSVVRGDVAARLPRLMTDVRCAHGFEGNVICFVAADGGVIGMIKKKTAWYVLLRALREKLAFGLERWTFAELKERILKRFCEIQAWLGFDDAFLQNWCKLSVDFAHYCSSRKVEGKTLRTMMPPLWTEFLRVSKRTDKFDVEISV